MSGLDIQREADREQAASGVPITDIKRFLNDLHRLFWVGESHEHNVSQASQSEKSSKSFRRKRLTPGGP